MSTLRACMALLALLWASAGTAQCRPSGRATFAAGLEALARGDLPNAAALFDELVAAQPDCAEARNNLAAVLVEQGRLDDAAAQLRRALELRPDYQRARFNLERLEALRLGQRPSQPAVREKPAAAALKTEALQPANGAPAGGVPAAHATPGVEAAGVLVPGAPVPPAPDIAAPPATAGAAGVPVLLGALEPEGATACVIEPAQSRVCVYRRAAGTITLDECYTILGKKVHTWPRWVTASDSTPTRIRLVDETGRRRLKVVPEPGRGVEDSLWLAQPDYEALVAKVVPWRTGWVVRESTLAAGAAVPEVRDALEHWRRAWEGKLLDEYAAMYSTSFLPKPESDANRWRDRKRYLFERSGAITVGITAPNIFILDDGTSVMTSFEQSYRSQVSASRGVKALRWQREGDRWKIVTETMLWEESGALPASGPRVPGG